jgi:hypothetical protein
LGSNGKVFEKLKTHSFFEPETATSSVDLLSAVVRRGSGVIVYRIQDRNQFNAAMTLLQPLQNLLASGAIQFVVTTPVSSPQLVDRLRAAGVSEIIAEPVNERAMIFKLERFGKTVQSFLQRRASQTKADEKKAVEKKETEKRVGERPQLNPSEGSKRQTASEQQTLEKREKKTARAGWQKKEKKANTLQWAPPVQHEAEIWVASDCTIKAVGDRWVIRHRGPGPGNGKWVEASIKGFEKLQTDSRCFEWTPHDPEVDPFLPKNGAGKGRWIFCGIRAPDFLDEMWWFSGRRPALFYVREGKIQTTKFATSPDGTLTVAKDSVRVTTLLPTFVETWKKGVKIRQKKGEAGAEETDEKSRKSGFGKGAGRAEREERQQVNRFGTLIRTPALPLESDFWTMNVEHTRALEKGAWQIALLGPTQAESTWEERNVGGSRFWVYVPKTKKVLELHREVGEWTFSGGKPRFENGLWLFEGELPRLDYKAPGGINKGTRFNVRKDRALLVSRDSKIALQLSGKLKKEAAPFGYVEKESEERKGIEFDYLDRREQKDSPLLEAEKEELDPTEFNARMKKEEEARGADDFLDEAEEGGGEIRDRRKKDAPRKAWGQGDLSGPSREALEAGIRTQTNEAGELFYEYPEQLFGKRGGRFDFVNTEVARVQPSAAVKDVSQWPDRGLPYEKFYIHVPIELLMGELPEIQTIQSFWLYAGLIQPVHDAGKQVWIFKLERPSELKLFGDLPLPAQKYLLELLESCRKKPEVAVLPEQPKPHWPEPVEPEDEASEELSEKKKEDLLRAELEASEEENTEEEADEGEEKTEQKADEEKEKTEGDQEEQGGKPSDPEESPAKKAVPEQSSPSEKPEEESPLEEDQKKSAPAPRPGDAPRTEKRPPSSEILEAPALALKKKRSEEKRRALEETVASVSGKVAPEVKEELQSAIAEVRERERAEVAGELIPEKTSSIPRGDPVQPSVRPIGLALYSSERARRRDLSEEEGLRGVLARWSQALGGLRLDLYVAPLLTGSPEGGESWVHLSASSDSGTPLAPTPSEEEDALRVHRQKLTWDEMEVLLVVGGENAASVPVAFQSQSLLSLKGWVESLWLKRTSSETAA